MMKDQRKLWVVEVDFDDGKGWCSTVWVNLTRDEVREECKGWRESNPGLRVRVRCYVPREEV